MVRSLDVRAAAAVPGVAEVVRLAEPGTELRLPPRGVVPRLAALLVTGETPQDCQNVLDRAAQLVAAEVDPLDQTGSAS
ncbi:hypothetical protein ACOBQB_06580 [Streptomyces sp. G5(2025)]|uniref:hypothetical protein n=1 Tax=Streptomyces sp. G5(2025) TaxID=3406628 RepID=UPI003C15A1E9